MNRVKIYIAGKSFVLQTAEEPGYVVRLGKQLDQRIRELMQGNNGMSVPDACILIAMDMLDQYEKTGANSDHLRREAQEYINQANEANGQVVELQKQIAKLEAENERLKSDLSLASLQSSLNKR